MLELFSEIRSINDFCNRYDDEIASNRSLINEQEPNSKNQVQIQLDRPKTLKDAEQIIDIYIRNYKNDYPYKEMLDPEFVQDSFTNPDYYWVIFRASKEHHPLLNGKILGCFTLVLEDDGKIAYMRGLNVDPDYHGKIGVKNLTLQMFREFFKGKGSKVSRMYCEARTSHTKSQAIAQVFGCQPYAIFPHKDHFCGKKETDCLMVAYSKKVSRQRLNSFKLPRFLQPLYEIIATREHFYDNFSFSEKIYSPMDWNMIFSEIEVISLNVVKDKFGYQHLRWEDHITGDWVEGLYTPQLHNIEKIKFRLQTKESLHVFTEHILQFIEKNSIEYIEWWFPASEFELICHMHNQGWTTLGYVPGWFQIPDDCMTLGYDWNPYRESDESDEIFEDAVIFGLSSSKPEKKEIRIVNSGKELHEHIMDNFNAFFNQSPRNSGMLIRN